MCLPSENIVKNNYNNIRFSHDDWNIHLEAFSGHIDNLVVSLFAFMLLSTTGTFI